MTGVMLLVALVVQVLVAEGRRLEILDFVTEESRGSIGERRS